MSFLHTLNTISKLKQSPLHALFMGMYGRVVIKKMQIKNI